MLDCLERRTDAAVPYIVVDGTLRVVCHYTQPSVFSAASYTQAARSQRWNLKLITKANDSPDDAIMTGG